MSLIGLTIRLNRSEILVAGVLSTLAAVALFGTGLAITAASAALAGCAPAGVCGDQAAALGQLLTIVPGALAASIGSASFLGASFGALTVASEIEGGTALLAWSIAPDRGRWLLERLAVLGAGLLALLFPWALATWFVAQSLPDGNGQMAIDLYVGAGQLLGVGAVAFATATLLGLRSGHVIPTVVGATVVTWFIAAMLGWVFAALRLAGAVDVSGGAGLILAVHAIDLQGDVHTLAEAAAAAELRGLPFEQLYRVVELGLPYGGLLLAVARETLCYVALSAVLISLAIPRVASRRPLN